MTYSEMCKAIYYTCTCFYYIHYDAYFKAFLPRVPLSYAAAIPR